MLGNCVVPTSLPPCIMLSVFGVLFESIMSSHLSSHPKCLANSTLMFALVALGGAGGLAASYGDSSFLLG